MENSIIFCQKVVKTIGSSFFWEDARVMVICAGIFSLLMRFVFKKISTNTKKWLAFIPYITCFIGMVFGGIMMCMPNGTGNVTQHFYLGILMYSLSTCICSIFIHFLIK